MILWLKALFIKSLTMREGGQKSIQNCVISFMDDPLGQHKTDNNN